MYALPVVDVAFIQVKQTECADWLSGSRVFRTIVRRRQLQETIVGLMIDSTDDVLGIAVHIDYVEL